MVLHNSKILITNQILNHLIQSGGFWRIWVPDWSSRGCGSCKSGCSCTSLRSRGLGLGLGTSSRSGLCKHVLTLIWLGSVLPSFPIWSNFPVLNGLLNVPVIVMYVDKLLSSFSAQQGSVLSNNITRSRKKSFR